MDKQFVTTSSSPRVSLEVSGNLRLKGQDSLEVTAKSDQPENVSLEAREDQVIIRATGDCIARVPRMANVTIQAARGDAVIKALEGELSIEMVDGCLELRDVANTKISRINGDLTVKNINGDITIDTVGGELSARSVQGDFSVTGKVQGNLNLRDVGGGANAIADGNIMLTIDPAPGHHYEFMAQGNVFCRLPDDASVEISVPKASQVRADLPGIHASAPVQTPYALTLGEGDAKLILSAEGNVTLDTHAPDWEMEDFDLGVGEEVNGMADTISEQISQQVESQVRMIEEQLDAQLSSLSMRLSAASLSDEQRRRIEERAREAGERAASRAQEKMRRAQQKMEQKMAAMQRKMEMKAREQERVLRHSHTRWNFNIPTPPGATPSRGQPVSEDERLIILRMLEEKKISMEEADQLLSALENNES